MDDFKKFSIRVTESTCGLVEKFAESNKMSRNAAVELLLKLGIQSLQNSETTNERFDDLEGKIKNVFRILHSHVLIHTDVMHKDKPEYVDSVTESYKAKAIETADRIFGVDNL